MMIKAVLFDFDGTLVDTNQLIIKSFNETFKELFPGRLFNKAEILECIGPTLEETGRKYYPQDPQYFIGTYRGYCWKYHDEMIELYPDIEEMLKELKKLELKLVIVTSKKRDMFTRGLEIIKLTDHFDWTVTADDVVHAKPHKEPIERVLNYYGLKPEECLMVGDNSHDINGAKAAGVKSVAVGWALRGKDYLKTFSPDYIINHAIDLIHIIEKEGA